MKDDEVGGACGTYEGEDKIHDGFWWGNPKEREHSVLFNNNERSGMAEKSTYQVVGLRSSEM
jgi:hypothetical protein